jgi:hypothetical protein
MIRNITAGYGIHIGGSTSYSTPYIDSTRPSAGMVRYLNNNLEIYDGSNWMIMQSSYPQVELDGVTQEAIQWVRRKMEDEKKILELAKTYPTVADALLARDRAEDAVKIAVALCKV